MAAAALDEDMAEQVLMGSQNRSECPSDSPASAAAVDPLSGSASLRESALQKRIQRLSRNLSEAIASLKSSFNLDSGREPSVSSPSGCRRHVWTSVVRSLTQLYPGNQLPEKLVSNLRKHYDSLPLSYAQAGFEMKEVFLHIKLMEQASAEPQRIIRRL